SIDWATDILVHKLSELRKNLALHKQHVSPALPLPGRGVTAACVFTGEPAVEEHKFGTNEVKLISASIKARLNFAEWADDALAKITRRVRDAGLWAVSDFEHFGTPGESSYIAIVHADGNRMGERIEQLSQDYLSSAQNRAYTNKLREFSQKANQAAETALRDTIHRLLDSRIKPKNGEPYWQQSGLSPTDRDRLPKVKQRRDNHKRPLLPFRPLLFGGDDVTFVCDGRLGIALAQHYLTVYGARELADGKKAVGRAGVAIVNTHFPFALGYQLAEALARSAKEAGDGGMTASLDWHFGVNGVVESLEATRRRAYTVQTGLLYARPLRLPAIGDWRQWATFEQLMDAFHQGREWHGRRNKLKALQSALRDGPPHVRAFLENYVAHEPLPKPSPLATYAGVERDGWVGDRCVYFDALEALDFFIPL
ncbi:MAG: hypothetical protein ACRDIB_07715, partial [Ardenticatenaceae bacterium]